MRKILTTFMLTVLFAGATTTSATAVTYKVQKGDSLWSISEKEGKSVEQLITWNELSSDLIFPNQTLKVDQPDKENQEVEYIVSKGDSLWKISKEYGVQVEQLKTWNQLTSDMIHPGQKLALQARHEQEIKSEEVQKLQTSKEKEPETVAPEQSQAVEQKHTEPKAEQKTKVKVASTEPEEAAPEPEPAGGKEMTVTATAYTAYCNGCSGVTATGLDLRANPNQKVIAVDPSVIPLGTKVHVEGYGTAIAGDTGGAIKGSKIDIFMPSKKDALNFGRKTVKIKLLN